jgi:hypothetical protein
MGDVYVKPAPVALDGAINNPVLVTVPVPAALMIGRWEEANDCLPEDYARPSYFAVRNERSTLVAWSTAHIARGLRSLGIPSSSPSPADSN